MIRSILVAEPNKTLESSKIVGLRVAPPNLRKRFVSQAAIPLLHSNANNPEPIVVNAEVN
jgi:hypothetical protein